MSSIESKVLSFINQHYPPIKARCVCSGNLLALMVDCDSPIDVNINPEELIDSLHRLDGLEGLKIGIINNQHEVLSYKVGEL